MDPVSNKKYAAPISPTSSSKIVPLPVQNNASQSSLTLHPTASKRETSIYFWEGLKRFFAAIIYCLSCQWLCIKSEIKDLQIEEKAPALDLQEFQIKLDTIQDPFKRASGCEAMVKEILDKQSSRLTQGIEKWGKKVPAWMAKEAEVEIPAKALEGHIADTALALDFCASLYPLAASPASTTDKKLNTLNPIFIKNAKISYLSRANIVLAECYQSFLKLMNGKESSAYAPLQKAFKHLDDVYTKIITEFGRVKNESYERNVRIALGKE